MTPVGKLPPQDWMHTPATRAVIEALSVEGAEVRFVGGCVRDALAGRPVRDLDIATQLPPKEVIRLIEAAGLKAVPTGIAHGTVTAVAHHRPFEITTLRVDVETYGRHAKVEFTDDWTADAARRDFTFNALSCAPDGTLYDPFGGVEDLDAGRVRFVGDARARIEEDYLRLLRFFRFQAYFGKAPPDPAVLAITSELAAELERLSGERVREELFKLLSAKDPVPVIETMIEAKVLQHILPVIGDGAILRALMRVEKPGEAVDPVLRLAALIEPTREEAERVAERLRLSNRQRFALVYLAEPPVEPDGDISPKLRHRGVRKLGAPLYESLLCLTWARRHAGDAQAIPGAALEAALTEAARLASKLFPVQGRDLLELGIAEGPELGRLLDEIEDWWAEQNFMPGKKECLAHARNRIGREN